MAPEAGEETGAARRADPHPARIDPVVPPPTRTVGRRGSGRRAGRGWADFRRFWAASSVSTFGDQLSLVALPLATFAVTDSALAVGIVASAEAVTAVALGVTAGALADRLAHRLVLVRTDLARALVLLLLVAALATPVPDLPALILAALVVGVLRIAHDASASAVLPIVVAERDLLAANGRMHASESASTAVGPALAGSLIAVGGPPLAFGADAASFLASAWTIRRIRTLDERPPPSPQPEVRLRQSVAEGVRVLLADRPMVRLVAVGAALNVMSVCLEAQFIPYADRVLGIGPLGIGALWAVGGTAAVLVSIVVAGRVQARGDVILAAVAVYAAGIAAAGLAPSIATAALAFAAGGGGSAVVASHLATLRQRRFPVRLQGRVAMAIRTVVLGLLPIPLIAGGHLSNVAGPASLFVVAAIVGALVTGWALVSGAGAVRAG